ncbi:RING/FYVE/PHD-type zinc finger family protein, partial [Striga asiatica]
PNSLSFLRPQVISSKDCHFRLQYAFVGIKQELLTSILMLLPYFPNRLVRSPPFPDFLDQHYESNRNPTIHLFEPSTRTSLLRSTCEFRTDLTARNNKNRCLASDSPLFPSFPTGHRIESELPFHHPGLVNAPLFNDFCTPFFFIVLLLDRNQWTHKCRIKSRQTPKSSLLPYWIYGPDLRTPLPRNIGIYRSLSGLSRTLGSFLIPQPAKSYRSEKERWNFLYSCLYDPYKACVFLPAFARLFPDGENQLTPTPSRKRCNTNSELAGKENNTREQLEDPLDCSDLNHWTTNSHWDQTRQRNPALFLLPYLYDISRPLIRTPKPSS